MLVKYELITKGEYAAMRKFGIPESDFRVTHRRGRRGNIYTVKAMKLLAFYTYRLMNAQ